MESLGNRVKREVSNAIWQALDAIEEKITRVLCTFWESTERVRTFLGDNWLPQSSFGKQESLSHPFYTRFTIASS